VKDKNADRIARISRSRAPTVACVLESAATIGIGGSVVDLPDHLAERTGRRRPVPFQNGIPRNPKIAEAKASPRTAAISSTRSPSVRLSGREPGLSLITGLSLLAEGGDALGKVGACPHLIAKMLLQGLGGQRLVGDRGADLPLDRNAEAVVFRDARLDYAGLKTRAAVFARALLAVGVRHGDRVALLITNRTEWTIAASAAAKIGALVAAISTFSTPRELAWAVEHSGAATLITLDVFRGQRFLDALDGRVPAPTP
jgi:hypothetical protein